MADVFAMSGNTPNYSGMLFNKGKCPCFRHFKGINNSNYTNFTPIKERKV